MSSWCQGGTSSNLRAAGSIVQFLTISLQAPSILDKETPLPNAIFEGSFAAFCKGNGRIPSAFQVVSGAGNRRGIPCSRRSGLPHQSTRSPGGPVREAGDRGPLQDAVKRGGREESRASAGEESSGPAPARRGDFPAPWGISPGSRSEARCSRIGTLLVIQAGQGPIGFRCPTAVPRGEREPTQHLR